MPEKAMPATLFEFAFESQLHDLAPLELARLVRGAWLGNRRAGITGEMCLAGSTVRQVIEGDAAAILAVAARILSDPRHSGIAVTAFGPIAARRFPDWRIHGLALGLVHDAEPASGVVPLRREPRPRRHLA